MTDHDRTTPPAAAAPGHCANDGLQINRGGNTLPRTVPVPVAACRLHPLAQRLLLILLAQHAESLDGSVQVAPSVMRRWRWHDTARLDRARRELMREGYIAKRPHERGARARYVLTWLDGGTA